MACSDTNPCIPDPCDQFDNCGCVNPNTFACTTFDGEALECLDIANGDDGDTILGKIETAVCDLQENKGKVLIDGTDTCPEYLLDKLEEGLNISFTVTGTGCDKKIVINAVEGGVPVDVNVKVSDADTTSGKLYAKIDGGTYITTSIDNAGGNEILQLEVSPASLISADIGNQLILGGDGALKTLYTAPDGSETIVNAGVGVIISGSGTLGDPYIISTNPSIQAARSCFDGVWTNVTLVASGNVNVVYASGNPQFRYRFDGSIEFRGSVTYTVAFGNYQSSNRSFTVPMGSIPVVCVTAGELAGTADLKSINYIDIPQAAADQYTQIYGYIIRKNAQNLSLVFQSSFIGATSKSVVVNFEGAVIHPNI